MSVLIKGAKMPEKCADCPCIQFYGDDGSDEVCAADLRLWPERYGRPDGCPLCDATIINVDDLVEAAETYGMEIVITVTEDALKVGGKKYVGNGMYAGDYTSMSVRQILDSDFFDLDAFISQFLEDLSRKGRM